MKDLPLHALRAFAAVVLPWRRACCGARAWDRALLGQPPHRRTQLVAGCSRRPGRRRQAWTHTDTARRGPRQGDTHESQGNLQSRRCIAGSEIGTLDHDLSDTIFAARWLLQRLPQLSSAPRIEVSVVVDQRLTDLRAEEVELAIRIGDGKWREVRCEPLMEDSLYPVMSPAYWKRAGRPDKLPARLTRLRLLHGSRSSGVLGAMACCARPQIARCTQRTEVRLVRSGAARGHARAGGGSRPGISLLWMTWPQVHF